MRGFLLLTGAVLLAAGVGVAAESASQPTTYGSGLAEFAAAFPTHPRHIEASVGPYQMNWYLVSSSHSEDTVFIVQRATGRLSLADALAAGESFVHTSAYRAFIRGTRRPPIPSGWVGYAPGSGACDAGLAGGAIEVDAYSGWRTLSWIPTKVRGRWLCDGSDVLLESASGIQWSAESIDASPGRVERFLESFSPVSR